MDTDLCRVYHAQNVNTNRSDNIVTIIVNDCLFYYRSILEKEGPSSLFRGLGPNLVGVAPSRYSKNTLHAIVAWAHVAQKCHSTYM